MVSCKRSTFVVLIGIAAFVLLLTAVAVAQDQVNLFSFSGSNGNGPYGGLVGDKQGNLYGTTYYGGNDTDCFNDGCGTVFELSPPSTQGGAWTETVLYAFQGPDGAAPYAGLILDSKGNLYGTTYEGGSVGQGTVFELSPPSISGGAWTETVLYSFQGNDDGAGPRGGLIFDDSGDLYGTTSLGGSTGSQALGTVFRLKPPSVSGGAWTEQILYRFYGKNGSQPYAALVAHNGALYGTTKFGGAVDVCVDNGLREGCGLVFMLTPGSHGPWTETILYSLDNANNGDGKFPEGSVVFDAAGNIYATASEGGIVKFGQCNSGCGTVFELTPTAGTYAETQVHEFIGKGDGTKPLSGLVLDAAGNLYGTTVLGGGHNDGTALQLIPPGQSGGAWTSNILYRFKGTDGYAPYAGLTPGKDGVFYGTTFENGGTSNCAQFGCGTVFAVTITPVVSLSPTSLNFGNQTVGVASAPQTVTLGNSGNKPLMISSIVISGVDSGDYAEKNNCASSLPVGAKCQIQVTFTPSTGGTRTASVVITDDAQKSPQSIPLSGNGVSPSVNLAPPSLTFPVQLVYTRSAPQAVTLTNEGPGVLAISNITVSGEFEQTNNCAGSLNAGANCTINVTFTPTYKDKFTGLVTITDNALDSPQTVPLTGTGTLVELTPTSANFGNQPTGTTSLPQTVTFTNQGHATVNIGSIAIMGADAADFAENNTCGSSVASGASCFITVTFTPLAKGTRTAAVALTDDGGGSPQKVPLSGFGT